MPELPEVETVRRGIDRYLIGKRLREVSLRREDRRWPIPEAVHGLVGRRCVRTSRRSKYLFLHFDGTGAPAALIHLGMSGRLWVDVRENGRADPPPYRLHEHWRMDFGTHLVRYVDARRFGVLDVLDAAEFAGHRLLRDLGPEPLESGFDGEFLFRKSRKRKVATKTFLMNAKNVVGIGNIYASEACFLAGVRPRRAVHRLTRAECHRLADAARAILERALAAGGTTIRDYISVDEDTGYFQRELMVYERAGKPCRECGNSIKRTVDTGRSTYYCPKCQR